MKKIGLSRVVVFILLSACCFPCGAMSAAGPDSKAARTELEKKIDCRLLAARQKVGLSKNPNGSAENSLVDVRISCLDVGAVSNAVLRLGGTLIGVHERYRCVNAKIPLKAIEEMAALPGVTHVRKLPRGRPNKVDTSEGVSSHLADEVHSTYGLTGKGVKVGVLSDSVDYLEDVQLTGDLPNVTVLDDTWGDGEGTAMLEIVHDVAPDAELYFATANRSMESFADNIRALADAGCKVIVDDYTYWEEPAFQDGIIAKAVADVTSCGCLFFTSAANSGNFQMDTSGTFEGDFVDTDGDGYMNFPDGKNYIELSKCGHNGVTLQWSDPWGASDNDYELEIEWPDGTRSSSTDTQDGDDNPYEEIDECRDGTCNGAKIKVKKYSGEARYIRIDTHRGRLTGGTAGNAYGHNASETAFSLGAASAREFANSPFSTSSVMEDYSSDGPRHMFFTADGNPLTPGNLLASGGVVLQKPDFVAADDVSCATPSYDDYGDPNFNPFCGTSASAPHAAAIAALMLEKKGDLTRQQVMEAWMNTSWRIDGPSWNECSGHGIINAKAAVEYVIDNFCGDVPQPGVLEFGSEKSSTFDIPGAGRATVVGVGGLTWDRFGDIDPYGTTCFVDSRIVDAEKDTVCNNDEFWCGAMTDMDMMFMQGWIPSGYSTVDDVVAVFAKDGESDIRWADDPSTFDPTDDWDWYYSFHEGEYGYGVEDYYTGMFRWLKDMTSQDVLSAVTTGTVDANFLSTLKASLPGKLLHLSVSFGDGNSHQFWGGCGVSHSVLCCGYACDDSVSGAAALKGLFVIDPDNHQYYEGVGGWSAPNSIAYCSVTWTGYAYEITGVWGETGTIDSQFVALGRKASAPPVPPTPETKHTVTFDMGDGTTVKLTVDHGKAAKAPEVGEREGYLFVGWDKDFSKVTEDLTVTAKWAKLDDVEIDGPDVVYAGSNTQFACMATYVCKGEDDIVVDVAESATWMVVKGDAIDDGDIEGGLMDLRRSKIREEEQVTIQATYLGFESRKFKLTIVPPRALTGLLVTGPADLVVTNSAAYVCSAVYDDGTTNDVTASATWTVTGKDMGETKFSGATLVPDANLTKATPVTVQAAYGGMHATADVRLLPLASNPIEEIVTEGFTEKEFTKVASSAKKIVAFAMRSDDLSSTGQAGTLYAKLEGTYNAKKDTISVKATTVDGTMTFKGEMDLGDSGVAEGDFEDRKTGAELHLRLTPEAVDGVLTTEDGEACAVYGAWDVLADKKDAKAAKALKAYAGVYNLKLTVQEPVEDDELGACPAVGGYLSVTVQEKGGKAKVAGVLGDGTKLSQTTSVCTFAPLGDGVPETLCVPIAAPLYSKKGAFTGLLWLRRAADGSVTADFATEESNWYACWSNPGKKVQGEWLGGYSACLVGTGGKFSTRDVGKEMTLAYAGDAPSLYVGEDSAEATVEALPDGLAVKYSGGKLTVKDKATKPKRVSEDGEVSYEYNGATDAGLKLKFNAKTGVFTGSFSLWYDIERYNERTDAVKLLHKSSKATVYGAWIGPMGVLFGVVAETDPELKPLKLKRALPLRLSAPLEE